MIIAGSELQPITAYNIVIHHEAKNEGKLGLKYIMLVLVVPCRGLGRYRLVQGLCLLNCTEVFELGFIGAILRSNQLL